MQVIKYSLELNAKKVPNLKTEKRYEIENSCMDSPARVFSLSKKLRLHVAAEEHSYLLSVDNKLYLTGIFEISHGTCNKSFVSPREIYIRALLSGATKVILVHNHPSGDPAPSKEDIAVTEKMKSAGDLMDVVLLDHVIVGRETYYSIKEQTF